MTDGEQAPEPIAGVDYNPIFEQLVGDESLSPETQGLVAYGLYKVAKREWVTEFRRQNGRGPNDDELKAYIATWTPSRMENLLMSAEQTLAEFAKDTIAQEEPRILRRALRGTFWRAVGPTMVGALLYTLILIALAIILARSGIDLIGILKTASGAPA
jgi:hypothetical protein